MSPVGPLSPCVSPVGPLSLPSPLAERCRCHPGAWQVTSGSSEFSVSRTYFKTKRAKKCLSHWRSDPALLGHPKCFTIVPCREEPSSGGTNSDQAGQIAAGPPSERGDSSQSAAKTSPCLQTGFPYTQHHNTTAFPGNPDFPEIPDFPEALWG